MHGGALAEELRVRDHEHVVSLQGPLDHPGGPHGHRGLVDHDGLGLEVGADLRGGILDIGEVGRTVLSLGRGHAQVHELGVGHRVAGTEDERELPGPQALVDEVVEASLEDGDLTSAERFDLLGDHVGAHDVVAEVGQAGAGGQTDIPGSDDGDPAAHTRSLLSFLGDPTLPGRPATTGTAISGS